MKSNGEFSKAERKLLLKLEAMASDVVADATDERNAGHLLI